MHPSGRSIDRLRGVVDDALVGVSAVLLLWPLLAAALPPADPGPGAWLRAVAVPAVTTLGAAGGIGCLVRRRPLWRHAPVLAAVVVAAAWFGGQGSSGPVLPWVVIGTASIILLRQFLGARGTDELLRDLHRQRAQLDRQAYRDPLTGVGNRALFRRHAEKALADARDTTTAILVFDLDGFKAVNDTWGHATGDELLRATAERLQANVRANDTVARLGGDEFVVLLPRLAAPADAPAVAARILRDLAQPLVIAERVMTIRASAGISLATDGGGDVDALLRQADLALYQAKADGEGAARQFDPALYAAAEQRRHDETELRAAVAAGQFAVHYQPIVDLAGEHTVGVEALVRWNHPSRGVLPPAAFLPLAESLGLVPELGRWVLEQACRQAAQWQWHAPGLEVNVNLSASQLGDPDLVPQVRAALEAAGLAPALLVLELTESVALTDLAESARVLHDLKALGIRLALDDFGTGFSSLSHLGALPVDVVKIDRSFVQAMAASSGASVAEAVLQIARTFNLAPVAEGVEDAEQAARLRDLDCAQAQGYHFARPMPAADLTDLLTRQAARLTG